MRPARPLPLAAARRRAESRARRPARGGPSLALARGRGTPRSSAPSASPPAAGQRPRPRRRWRSGVGRRRRRAGRRLRQPEHPRLLRMCVWGRRWRKEGCGTHPEPSHRQRRSSATGSATGALGPRPRRAPGRLCLGPAVRTQPHRTRQRRRKVTASRHARPRRTRRRCTAAHRSLRDRAQGARTGWVSSQRTF